MPILMEQTVLQLEKLSDDVLGEKVKEYMRGQVYDVSWEGFTLTEQRVIMKFWDDFLLAVDNGL